MTTTGLFDVVLHVAGDPQHRTPDLSITVDIVDTADPGRHVTHLPDQFTKLDEAIDHTRKVAHAMFEWATA